MIKIWGGEGVYYYFEEKAWKETQPFFWHLSPMPKPWLFTSFAFGNTGVSRLWHRGCDIQAPFSHHIHFCLSQHPISRILPSRNRQCVNCSSPRNNISHILHETQCTNSQFADISPQVSRQLQHRRLFLEFNGSQRWKTHTGQFSRTCVTNRLLVVSTQTGLKLPGKLSMYGFQGCQHCQLQTLQK